MGESFFLEFEMFLRTLKASTNKPYSFLLGAGASIESGIPSAYDCIWQWKKDIFLSHNDALIESCNNVKLDSVKRKIQLWLDSQGIYPKEDSAEEYSFYAEKAFLSEEERRNFFQKLVEGHNPSLGYHLISILAQSGFVKYVWTTNFDGMMQKCAHQYTPLIPIEITAETSNRIRLATGNELFCIELHGDYKYGKLKNTESELANQDAKLISVLSNELQDHDLIVIGYSGRDYSLLKALGNIYSKTGRGRLFWCGYGQNINNSVNNFLNSINNSGRKAYYIPTEGFDSLMYRISRYCLGDDKNILFKIDNIKKDIASASFNETKTSFEDFYGTSYSISKTNIYPISFPSHCLTFEINEDTAAHWTFCKYLYSKEIMAIPYNKMIYAWGEQNIIMDLCKDKIKGSIYITPIEKEFFKTNGAFKELLLKTITFILAKHSNLSYSKNKIWNPSDSFTYKNQLIHKGIKLKLLFSDRYSFISFSPSFFTKENLKYSKKELKEIANLFYSNIDKFQANKNEYYYITNWKNKLIKNNKLSIYFPPEETKFKFIIGGNQANIGIITDSQKCLNSIPQNQKNQIIAHGKEFEEPKLSFYNREMKSVKSCSHPMLGLKNNTPIDYPISIGLFPSTISLGVICPIKYEKQFHIFLEKLNNFSKVQSNFEYLIDFPGFSEAFKTNLNIPDYSSNSWLIVNYPNGKNLYEKITNFIKEITHQIDQLNSIADVIIIYLPEQYEELTLYESKTQNINLHDYIKAYAAQKQIATQIIREKTLGSSLLCHVLWSLSLAIYVKSGRIPWSISDIQKDTAFAGIGYSIKSQHSNNSIVIGCSHIYSSDGQGMKYKLSKIQDVTFDSRNNPYLSEEEAYRLGIGIKELFYKSFSDLPKRVVIHKRTPFKKEEIKGLVESLSSSGIKDIELLEINYEESIKCFSCNQDLSIDAFPVKRGLCFYFNYNTIYLYTHGICPSIKNPQRRYLKGGKSLPKPLKIVRHYGSGDISQIAKEILSLSKMNWNSFDLYSKLPCTLDSSSAIARIGWLLSQYEGTSYDYRFFM